MPIHFECPECGTPMTAADGEAGLTVACEDCGHSFAVPAFVPKWKRPAAPRDPADKRPAWVREADDDDHRAAVPPNPWLRVGGIALIVWGVMAAISAAAVPADPDPAFRLGQAIGGSVCSLLLVIGGVVLIRRGRAG